MGGLVRGKVALVTGGSSGIGRAACLAFAREGAKVVVSDVEEEKGEETVSFVRERCGEAVFVKCDVSRASEVEDLIKMAVQTYGRLDCAFNNAGIAGARAFTADASEANFDKVIAVNLKGVWLCMKYEISQMLAHGGGAIVNNASAWGLVGGRGGTPHYAASKGGVIQLTRTAAIEYADKGIRVNAICPASVRTPMIERVIAGNPELEAQFAALQPVGRIGRPEEIADIAVWLCSDQASFVTGHPMVVDGGLVAR